MGLFSKKKKTAGAEGDQEIESADMTGGEDTAESDSKEKKKKDKKNGTIGRIRKRIRIIITRKHPKDSGGDGEDDESAGKKKPKKEKKAKKPRQKKEKKPKAKKKPGAAKNGDPDGDTEEAGKRNIKLIILISSIAGGLVVGIAAFGIVMFLNRPSIDDQLLKAQQLMDEQQYDKAGKAYQKIIKKDDTLVTAYIGLADALVAQENTEAAVQELTGALEPTSSAPEIQAKIDELVPPEEPAPEEEKGPSTEPIAFRDAAFESMLRLAIGKPAGASISEADLSEVTVLKILGGSHAAVNDDVKEINSFNSKEGYEIGGVLYTDRGNIRSLSDLAHLTNLRKLTIAYNSVSDIRGLEELSKLETVGLYFNDISDISPLSPLTGLKYLYVYGNRISNILPLAQLTNLEQLWLSQNNITDISPVRGLSALEELFIDDNQVADITPISKLTKLCFFYADRNNISDISAVKDMPALTDVSFIDNPVTDLSPAANINNVNRSYG